MLCMATREFSRVRARSHSAARRCSRKSVAPRCRAKRHRDQQRAPGFRLCLAQQIAEAALPGEAVCASLKGMAFEPCFALEKTAERSFRGSWMGFAYCDFTQRTRRRRHELAPEFVRAAIARGGSGAGRAPLILRHFVGTLAPRQMRPNCCATANRREWDGPAVLPPRTAQRMTGGLEARGAHRHVP